MLVKIEAEKIIIKAIDDLKYALSQIEKEVEHYRQRTVSSVSILVELTVSGKCTDSINEIRKKLQSQGSTTEIVLNRVKQNDKRSTTSVGTSYVEATVVCQHEACQCTGELVVKDIKSRLRELREAGFNLTARPVKEMESEAA